MSQIMKRRRMFVASLLSVAWILAAVAIHYRLVMWGVPDYPGPTVSFVAASQELDSDVASLVGLLYRALVVSVVVCSLVEAAKWCLPAQPGMKRSYLLMVILQIVLIADVVRALAPDWTLYGLHFLGLLDLSVSNFDRARFAVPRFGPMPSLLLLILTTLSVVLHHNRPGTALDSGEAPEEKI